MLTNAANILRNSTSMTDKLHVGQDALANVGLVNRYGCSNIVTEYERLNMLIVFNVVYEYFHFRDTAYLRKLDDGSYTPTAERALIDCMTWQTKNHDEGMLIEALQNYQRMGHKPEDLYECADHYNLDHIVVDYWWKEALEESDMSMG